MIRNRRAYERVRGREDLEALRSMTDAMAVELTEALLSSSIVREAADERVPRARNLARALGISPARARTPRP